MTRYLFAVCLVLASCTAAHWHAPMPLPAAAAPALPTKVKARGPVTLIYQVASPGAVADPNVTDNRKLGQRGGAGSAGPSSPVTNSSKRGGVSPWWFVATAIGAVVVFVLVRAKFAAWWARPG